MTAKTLFARKRWELSAAVLAFWLIVLIGATCMGASEGASSRPAATGAQAQTASDGNSSTGKLTVELVQPTPELPPNGQATALLVVRNTGAGTLRSIRVTAVINAAVALESNPPFDKALDLVAKGEFAWALTVSNKGDDQASGNVILRIDYSQGEDAAKPVPQVAHAIIQVTSHDSAAVAEVKMESTLESLDEQHPGKVYLLVTNKSDRSLTVSRDKIIWHKPSFIKITPDVPDGTEGDRPEKTAPADALLKLSPNQMQVIPFDVGTLSKVQSGKHLLVAIVPLELGGVSPGRIRNITVTKEVQVGVIAESTVLKLLGIPSFLFIPGFIALIIWRLLWKGGLFRSKRDTGSFPIEIAENVLTAQFLVAAITISIPVIWLYILIVNRDFLGNYGLSDLVNIWMASVLLLGIGGYCLIIGGHRLQMGRITPSEKDEAIDMLWKLERQGLGVCLDQVEFPAPEKGDQRIGSAFLLQKKSPERDTVWVGPAIEVRWEKGADQKLKDEVDIQRALGGNPGKLAQCLGKAGKTVHVGWKIPEPDSTGIAGPREIPTAGMKDIGVDCIVEVS